MAEIILSDSTFDKEVLQSDIPVLVDFWAPWCGPCRMLSPIIEQLAEEYTGKLKVAKCNVDDCPEVSQKYYVQSIPTLKVFHNGKEAAQSVGVSPKQTIVDMFSSLI